MFTHPLRYAGALAFALISSLARAETLDLEPVTVTATRLEPTSELLPVGAVVIDRTTLDKMPGDTLADALDSVAGINSRRLYGIADSGSSVDMLGFGAAGTLNTLVLLNGRRLNTVDLAAVDFSVVPLSAIERIEVLPASGAVLYGNGAVGGAINIITRASYADSLEATLRAGSYSSRGFSASLAGGTASRSALASARYFESDGYRDNNDLEQWNAFTDWHHVGERTSFQVAVLADKQKTRLPGPRVVDPGAGVNELDDDPRGTATPNDWADQDGIHLMPGLRTRLSENVELQVDSSVRLRRQQSFLEGTFGFSSYNDAQTLTLSLAPRLLGELELGGQAHRWSFGVDLQSTAFEREVSLDENSKDQPIHQVDIDQDVAAVYLVDTFSLGPSTTVTAGARHEWVKTEGRDDYEASAPAPPCFSAVCDGEAAPLSLDQNVGIYSLGLRHWLAESLSAFVNVERNARYASVDETFESKYDFPTDTTSYTLEPLDIQTGRLVSTGLSWRQARQHSTLTAWHGDFDNEIHFDPATFDNINLDPTRRYGMSLNSQWQLNARLALTLNAAWQRARFRDGQHEGNEVPLVPRQTLYARFDWQAEDWLGLSLSHRYVGKRYFDNDQENDFGQRMPDYGVTDAELRLTSRTGAYCTVGVYNLEDDVNFDYGVASTFTPGRYNAYPLPERHAMLTLGLKL